MISLDQPDAELAAALRGRGGEDGYDVVADYLWGRPTEIFIDSLIRDDMEVRSLRTRLVQAGEMAGSAITLPGSALRSAGLEVIGMGTGTMPPRELIGEMLDRPDRGAGQRRGQHRDRAGAAGRRGRGLGADQQGRRPVLIP